MRLAQLGLQPPRAQLAHMNAVTVGAVFELRSAMAVSAIVVCIFLTTKSSRRSRFTSKGRRTSST